MKNGELQEYLKGYKKDGPVSIIVADPERRLVYPVTEHMVITDMDCPCLLLSVGPAEDMDAENLVHTDLTDQIELDL